MTQPNTEARVARPTDAVLVLLPIIVALAGCPHDDTQPDVGDAGGGDMAATTDMTSDGAGTDEDGGMAPVSPVGCSVPPVGGPTLPQVSIDTTLVAPTGKTISVASGGDLQAALDSAALGDVISLEAGATFTGTFTLPNKTSGTGWITIRSSAADADLPAPGTRVRPSDLPALATIAGTGSPVIAIQTAQSAHHFRFIGIEVRPQAGAFSTGLIRLGAGGETDVSQLPHDIIFDRCYIHGDPTLGGRRGIALNSGATAVIDSYFSDWKENGSDSQAIGGWNGSGPYRIHNNYLEGAGENLMLGGSDPSIPNLIPADIEICRNHFRKPLSWKADDPSYAGTPWTVKNLLELKLGRRILVADNVFEQNWAMGQVGFAWNIKSAQQNGNAAWSVTEHVTLLNNVIRKSPQGISINAADPNTPLRTNNVRLYNILLEEIGTGSFGGSDGRLFQVLGSVDKVSIEHVTGRAPTNLALLDGTAATNMVFKNNVADCGQYGVKGTGTGAGNATLATYWPGAVFTNNVLSACDAPNYPAGNAYPATWADIGFVDVASGNLKLNSTSPYRATASDGTDPGADRDAILAATAGVLSP